jgi:hypothetical protein
MNGFYFGTFQKTRVKIGITQNHMKIAKNERRDAKFGTAISTNAYI